jgi:Flp pilus assembly protein TadG
MKIALPSTRVSARRSHPEDGQTTVVMALFMATFLFGFVALGIDTEALFHAKRQAQAAADAAAVAAAEEYSNGPASEYTAAVAMAKMNGFDNSLAVNPATVSVATPSTGNYANTTGYLQVTVSQPISTFFARVVTHQSTVTVSARAVAGAGQGAPTCICLTGTSGTDLFLSNGSKLNPSGCGTTVDSNSSSGGYPSPMSSGPAVYLTGGSSLGGISIGSVASNWDTGSNVSNGASIASGTKVVQGLGAGCSPPMPVTPTYTAASCTADPLSTYGNGGSSYSIGPGGASPTITQSGSVVCYNNLTIGANGDKVNLNPGIYVINGGSLHFESGANNASNTGGSGVVFYLKGNASLTIDNGANVNLTAPTSGTYAGIVVYQDAADTQPLSIQGGSNTSFNGAIYAPNSNVNLGNGSSNAISADLLAKTLTMTGGGTLSSTALSNFGTLGTSVAKLGE